MTEIDIPDLNEKIKEVDLIQSFLKDKGIEFQQWQTDQPLTIDANEKEVLGVYKNFVDEFMKRTGFQSCDVISVNHKTPEIASIRDKFLKEHTHSEDEVRFFVDGSGLFWFNLENSPVFSVLLKKGDFISVPKGCRHWFDLQDPPNVKAIRIFSTKEGWVANYTESGIDSKYNPKYT